MQIIKSTEARKYWRNLLDNASRGEGDIVIERNGKSVAVLMNYDSYTCIKAILDELHTIHDADKLIEEWLKNPQSGRLYSEIRNQLIEEGILAQQINIK